MLKSTTVKLDANKTVS